MERDQEAILKTFIATIGQRGPLPSMVRQTPPLADIRIESGDIIEELEGNAEVAPEVEDLPAGTFLGGREKYELLFCVFVHGS